ncbi:glycine zipper domain-containing protein [Marinobacterium mangrovicola]|uniref:Glycine zipper domain-containing protein n=1 Tax=Marinobacterium mangrovicola TaxID=1476959 RepID=A0A4R1GUZ2_9GAMM|nr:glycine zipper domain-containing protein [Marinobacterium mangrovicola]TCK08142.1 hypothetical protein CLV83_0215 [Marinobacterium mangrovicola]
MKKSIIATAVMAFLPAMAMADDLRVDSAVGGAIGGALGGVLGAEVGGREGAIAGSGIGAAVGTAVNTRDHDDGRRYDDRRYDDRKYRDRREYREVHHYYDDGRRNRSSFCPPGQAKKGRC